MTDRPLRILMVAPTPFFADRGCHVRILEEIRALQGRGHEVHLVTYGLGGDVPGVSVSRSWVFPWYRKLSAGPSWQKPLLDIFLFLRVLREGRRFRPHILHAHLHEGAFLGVFLKKLLRVPLVFDCQGSLTGELVDHGFFREKSLLWRLFGILERVINGSADFILTSSGKTCRDLTDTWHVSPEKVAALVDAVDPEVFRPAATTEKAAMPKDVPVVAYLGVLNRYQGTDILLDAARELKRRGEPVHFLVMGYPEEPWRSEAGAAGLQDMMTFTGRVPYGDAPGLLAGADIAVSPKVSLTEANGKLLNYMACGLPTVAFDTPVNRELLGETGVYAPRGDVQAFTDAIAGLLHDPERRRRLRAQARERAVREHSWQARGGQLERVYHLLLGEK